MANGVSSMLQLERGNRTEAIESNSTDPIDVRDETSLMHHVNRAHLMLIIAYWENCDPANVYLCTLALSRSTVLHRIATSNPN